MTEAPKLRPKRSLFSLIADLPRLLAEAARSEIEALKKEMVDKAKHAGVGIGLLAVAGFFAFFAFAVLVAAAVLGIAVALPAWAAALIVATGLLLLTALLVLIGVSELKRGAPPTTEEAIERLKKGPPTS